MEMDEGQVNRTALDFDFEPICSVTLAATSSVYACLACGRFFQGRSQSTPAYLHSLNLNHYMFINLTSGRVYQLPDGVEVDASPYADIQNAIYPAFPPSKALDVELLKGTDLHGKDYVSGFLGLNNIKHNDYINAVFQLLTRITPLRVVFLQTDLRSSDNSFLKSYGLLTKKLWNLHPFKASISPQEFLQAVRTASAGKFMPTVQSDASEFLAWCLNYLERSMAAAGLPPVLATCIKGQLQVASSKVILDSAMRDFYDEIAESSSTKTCPYFFLTLDLPPIPLFQDNSGKNVIPQTSLSELLRKYDGMSVTSRGDTEQRFLLNSLPKYLILTIKRMVKTEFGAVEKNKTVVSFPVTDLQIGQYKYNLIANISHVGEAKDGQYVVHARHWRTGTWFDLQDLSVKEIHPQTIFLTDTYIQLWERSE